MSLLVRTVFCSRSPTLRAREQHRRHETANMPARFEGVQADARTDLPLSLPRNGATAFERLKCRCTHKRWNCPQRHAAPLRASDNP